MFAPSRPVGLVDGRLRACPASPNCVCSQDADAGHAIAPLGFTGPAPAAWEHLQQVIRCLPRTRVVEVNDQYMRVEFTTALLRFVDDVEFLLDAPGQMIHVRSASRVGYSDLGTNRKRVESVRAALQSGLQ